MTTAFDIIKHLFRNRIFLQHLVSSVTIQKNNPSVRHDTLNRAEIGNNINSTVKGIRDFETFFE